MIKAIGQEEIAESVQVIRESFFTVANQFGFTESNAPRFTAFATTEDRLRYQLLLEQRPMYAYYEEQKMVGYYSLSLSENGECELNNLCVLPAYRHKGIGEELLQHAFQTAEELGCKKMNIGIVEENTILRKWYAEFGFVHIGTKKFDFFPFTCGYMEISLPIDKTGGTYDGKYFVPKINTENGEVDGNTVFEYHQKDSMVWADYAGGEIVKGNLLGKVTENGELDFYYQHLNKQGQLRVGVCHSVPHIREDGKIELSEKWKWLNGDETEGESVIIER